MHCMSYIHYTVSITKETNKPNDRLVSCIRKKNHLQLIALPQPFLHSLLHKSRSRS